MNFLVQPMPPSTDYMLHFPGFKEIWCDMTSYEVPNAIISELCCSCQKERHGFSSGPPSKDPRTIVRPGEFEVNIFREIELFEDF